MPDTPRTRPRLLRLEIAASFRLDLGAPPPPAAATPFDIREVARGEHAQVLGALGPPVADLDAIAPAGWRCFAAFADGAPVHVSYVALRPGRPLLFGALTAPAARGRGAFRATVPVLGAALRAAGEGSLFSSVSRFNAPSVRAHRAAGFQIVRHQLEAFVRGVSLRSLARRLVKGGVRRAPGPDGGG